MEWQKAKKLIEEKVKENTDINTNKSTYRIVKSIGSIPDNKSYGYCSEKGFIVPIGRNVTISIPWKMLEKCFLPIASGEEYDGHYFSKNFPLQNNNHPCHVHAVGQIFVKAGIAKPKNKRAYIGV